MTVATGTTAGTGRITGDPAQRRGYAGLNRGSRNLIRLIAICVIAIFVLVGLEAYSATLQHANNVLQSENSYLEAEIDSLNSQIVEETKITAIEKTATKKYGMVYPTSDNCVTIHKGEEMAGNLAATIKSEAYN